MVVVITGTDRTVISYININSLVLLTLRLGPIHLVCLVSCIMFCAKDERMQ